MGSIRTVLRTMLRTSMRMRDREATNVLRSALAAIDNAEAVPVQACDNAGAIENSMLGAGSADVPRRELSEDEMVDVVRSEIDEMSRAASLVATSAPDQSVRLHARAEVLTVALAQSGH